MSISHWHWWRRRVEGTVATIFLDSTLLSNLLSNLLSSLLLISMLMILLPSIVTATTLPTYSQWTILPNAEPQAGESFYVKVIGTDVDRENNKIAIMDFSDSTKNCLTAPLFKMTSIASYSQINSVSCNGPDATGAGVLHCGPITVYQKHLKLGFCICGADVADPVPACNTQSQFFYGFSRRFSTTGPTPGQTFALQAMVPGVVKIEGDGLGANDMIKIAKKSIYPDCMSTNSLNTDENILNVEDAKPDTTSGSVEIRWIIVKGKVVEKYIVCWCGATRQDCTQNSEYQTQAGELQIEGPFPNQELFMVLGLGSTLPIEGMGMKSTDRIRIVHKTNVDCGGPGASQHIGVVDRGALGAPNRAEPLATPSMASWDDISITAAGQYRICWCGFRYTDTSSGCERDTEFNVDAGLVTVSGPIRNQDPVYPILGLPFEIFVEGEGLTTGDRIIIIEGECGSSKTNSDLISMPPVGPPTTLTGPDKKQSWQGVVFTKKISMRLCWCARYGLQCDSPEKFNAQVGVISPIGPENNPGNPAIVNMTVINGEPFNLQVQGNTAYSTPIFFPTTQIRLHPNRQITTCGDFGTALLSDQVMETICWDYVECKRSPAAVGGLSTGLDPIKYVEFNPLAMKSTGVFRVCLCIGGSQYMLDANGNPDPNSPNPMNDGYMACTEDKHFAVDVGEVHVKGVPRADMPFVCYQDGENCIVFLKNPNPSLNDKVRLIQKDNTNFCSNTEPAPPSFFGFGSQIEVGEISEDENGNKVVKLDFGDVRTGGSFDICYCQRSKTSDCSEQIHYFQNVGTIQIGGVSTKQDVTMCVGYTPCFVKVYGVLLTEGANVLLLDGTTTGPADCGTKGQSVLSKMFEKSMKMSVGQDLYGFKGDKGSLGSGIDYINFELGIPEMWGEFTVCYCDPKLTPAGECEYQTQFNQFAGKLHTRQVDTIQNLACIQGEECNFQVIGPQMTIADRIAVIQMDIDVAGQDITPDDKKCGQVNAKLVDEKTFTPGPQQQPTSVDTKVPDLAQKDRANYIWSSSNAPGKYRVCYCPGIPGGNDRCQGLAYYQHDIGTIRIVGVINNVEMAVLPTTKVISVKVTAMVPGSRLGCVAAVSPMSIESRVPTTADTGDCFDTTLDRFSGKKETDAFPLCIGRTESELLTVMGENYIHIEIDQALQEKARAYNPSGNILNYHVWCYSLTICGNGKCVMPATKDGTKISPAKSDSPYVTNLKQDVKDKVGDPIDIGLTIENISPEIAAEARMKIVDPLEDNTFDNRVKNTAALIAMFNAQDGTIGNTPTTTPCPTVGGGCTTPAPSRELNGLKPGEIVMMNGEIRQFGNANQESNQGQNDHLDLDDDDLRFSTGDKRKLVSDAVVATNKVIHVTFPTSKLRGRYKLNENGLNKKAHYKGELNDDTLRQLQVSTTTTAAPTTAGPTTTPTQTVMIYTTTTTSTTTKDPCNRFRLAQAVGKGLVCGSSGTAKCSPAPKWNGANNVLKWEKIEMQAAGSFEMCYCDRHIGTQCLQWTKVGDLQVQGPLQGQPDQFGNPGETSTMKLRGIGFEMRDRVHIVYTAHTCGKPPPLIQQPGTPDTVTQTETPPATNTLNPSSDSATTLAATMAPGGNTDTNSTMTMVGGNGGGNSTATDAPTTSAARRLIDQSVRDISPHAPIRELTSLPLPEINHKTHPDFYPTRSDQERRRLYEKDPDRWLKEEHFYGRNLQIIWQSASPSAVAADGSSEEFVFTLNEKRRYKICWCGGDSSCLDHAEYKVTAAFLEVEEKVDCEMTEFTIVSACSAPCGGGIKQKRRRIITQSKGGGKACPANAESLIDEVCNTEPCPVAKVDSVSFYPSSTAHAGRAFQLKLMGSWMDPQADRIILLDPMHACGSTRNYLGGAECTFGGINSGSTEIYCGDGASTITINRPTDVRVCFCDASAGVISNQAGTGFEIAAALQSEGIFAAGCDDVLNYLISPLSGSVLTIHPPPGAPTESDDVEIGSLTLSVPLFVVCVVALSLVFVVFPGLYFGRNYYINKRIEEETKRYLRQVDPVNNISPEEAVEELKPKKGFLQKAKEAVLGEELLALQDANQQFADKFEIDKDQQTMLLAWDEYYQSLGYPPGTAWTLFGVSGGPGGGAGLPGQVGQPQQQAGPPGLMALTASAYDPNDIYGGYGANAYQFQPPPQPPQQQAAVPGLLALEYDGGQGGQQSQMKDFLEQSFSGTNMPTLPKFHAAKPLSASMADKVKLLTGNSPTAGDTSEQPITPRAPAEPAGPSEAEKAAQGLGLEPNHTLESQKPARSMRSRPSAIGIVGNASGKPDDILDEQLSPKSLKIKKEKEALESKSSLLKEQIAAQEKLIQEEQKAREDIIKSKLENLKSQRGTPQPDKQPSTTPPGQQQAAAPPPQPSTPTSGPPPPPPPPPPRSDVSPRNSLGQTGGAGAKPFMPVPPPNKLDNTMGSTMGGTMGKRPPPPPPPGKGKAPMGISTGGLDSTNGGQGLSLFEQAMQAGHGQGSGGNTPGSPTSTTPKGRSKFSLGGTAKASAGGGTSPRNANNPMSNTMGGGGGPPGPPMSPGSGRPSAPGPPGRPSLPGSGRSSQPLGGTMGAGGGRPGPPGPPGLPIGGMGGTMGHGKPPGPPPPPGMGGAPRAPMTPGSARPGPPPMPPRG